MDQYVRIIHHLDLIYDKHPHILPDIKWWTVNDVDKVGVIAGTAYAI